MRFYGLSIGEYRNLTLPERSSLWECITIIEAQEMLNQTLVVTMPHMKKQARDKSHKKLHTLAYPDLHDTPKTYQSLEDVQKRLSSYYGDRK